MISIGFIGLAIKALLVRMARTGMIVGLNGMACLADLQGRYPRDCDVPLVRNLRLVSHFPTIVAGRRLHERVVGHRPYRHGSNYLRRGTNDELLDTASYAISNGSQT